MSIAYLLSGSNMGDRREYLCNAEKAIAQSAGVIMETSPVYESPAWGFEHPTAFLNQAMKLKTTLGAHALLKAILAIESKMGRQRSSDRYEARNIDIDILFYDEIIMDEPDLVIPHPRLHLRRFALKPLSMIAGDYKHPFMGKTVDELLSCCPDDSELNMYDNLDYGTQMEGKKDAV